MDKKLNRKLTVNKYNSKPEVKQRMINYRLDNVEKLKEYKKLHRLNNKEKYKLQDKNYRLNNPVNKIEIKDKALQKNYNITLEEYNIMLKVQDNKCAICNRNQSECKKSLAVDHNHKTGQIRGLLCFKCNSALGNFKEDNTIIKNALNYLNYYNG